MYADATRRQGHERRSLLLRREGRFAPPGESFHGYVIEKQIGKGGLGTIWLGRHQMLDTLFAIKILDPEIAAEKPEYVTRFVREAKLATRIRHPNLVAVHDAGYDETHGVYFLVMDYVKGDTLRSTIAFCGAQPEKEAVRIILQVADVLASPKAVVDALVRMGYAAPSSGGTEFATEEDAASDGMVQDLIPDIVAAPRAGEDLVLETQDKDMQEFMARLRRKRMRRRIAWAIGAVLLILTAALVWRILT